MSSDRTATEPQARGETVQPKHDHAHHDHAHAADDACGCGHDHHHHGHQHAHHAAPVRSLKVGRNEPCPCGSGQKYKKCCLARAG